MMLFSFAASSSMSATLLSCSSMMFIRRLRARKCWDHFVEYEPNWIWYSITFESIFRKPNQTNRKYKICRCTHIMHTKYGRVPNKSAGTHRLRARQKQIKFWVEAWHGIGNGFVQMSHSSVVRQRRSFCRCDFAICSHNALFVEKSSRYLLSLTCEPRTFTASVSRIRIRHH